MIDIFGGVTSLLGTGLQVAAQDAANRKNEQLTRESWGREDNAIQRRMADMKKAGINPLMAAGSAATSSGAAQMQSTVKNNAGSEIVEALKGLVQKDQIEAQTNLIRAQQLGTNAQTHKTETETRGLEQEIEWNKSTQESRMSQLIDQTKMVNYDQMLKAAENAWYRTTDYLSKATYTRNEDGSYQQHIEEPKNNFTKQKEAELELKRGQAEAAKYTDDIAQQQLVGMLLAAKSMGMENKMMEEMMKTNPGLADGIKKWIDIISGATPNINIKNNTFKKY